LIIASGRLGIKVGLDLGDRNHALQALTAAGQTPGPRRGRAFRLALQAMTPSAAEPRLRELPWDPAALRLLIQGSGIAGDPTYVPWPIGLMGNPVTARLAGEALSLLTGADFDKLKLDGQRPEDFEYGPNDDPSDASVDMVLAAH
jgi:hypothetical protein